MEAFDLLPPASCLFGTTPDPAPAPLTFWCRILQQAYNNTISASLPSAILLHADKSWHQNSAHLAFGATYHTWFPSIWARQILSANINNAFLEHLYDCIHRPKSTKPCSATYAYPLAIGCHTPWPYIQPTTQQWHDCSRVGTSDTQSRWCILIMHVVNFHLRENSQTDKRHTIIT
jgi:hypothetical protein